LSRGCTGVVERDTSEGSTDRYITRIGAAHRQLSKRYVQGKLKLL
jgi:hypothetical protein